MSRIAKKDAAHVLDVVGQHIVSAAGPDGVTARADLTRALDGLQGTEKVLTDRFFRFMDHRDFKTGARITAPDVERAIAYAKEHLLAKYDANHNGYSRGEIAQMSMTGQLAVQMAAELKGIKLPAPPAPSSSLGRTITAAAKDADYVSETDSTPAYVEAPMPAGAVDVMTLFKDVIDKVTDHADPATLTFREFTPDEVRGFFPGQAHVNDPNDPFDVKNAAAWDHLGKVVADNITGLRIFKVGPKDAQTGALATDRGAYELFVVGKSAAGKLAGIAFEAVET